MTDPAATGTTPVDGTAPAAGTQPVNRSDVGDAGTIVGGLETLKVLILLGVVLAFCALYAYFMAEIWDAKGGTAPDFDDGLLAVAGALSGILGSGFALALGVAKDGQDGGAGTLGALAGKVEGKKVVGRLGPWLRRLERGITGVSLPVTLGIWSYAVVAAAIGITTLLNTKETPEAIKAFAAAFGGYVIAFATNAFRSVRAS